MDFSLVEIGGIGFTLPSADPFTFPGVHSGTDLSGLTVELTARSTADVDRIEELLAERTATVVDPFVDRQYDARLTLRSTSHQDGRPEKWYCFEVRELDHVKTFSTLEIEGQPFTVIRNTESSDNGVVGFHVLLQLSSDEFNQFHNLLRPSPVQVRRVGVDETPITRRFGTAGFWSSHQEEPEEFRKRIVHLYPVDPPPSRLDIASGTVQAALADMVIAVSARYEALIAILVANGQLNEDDARNLTQGAWQELVDDQRRVALRSDLRKIDDAEAEFDRQFPKDVDPK